MARITIPHAVTDFADLRERGFYYVDKTNYIPGLEDYNAPVFPSPPFREKVCSSPAGSLLRPYKGESF